METLPEEQPFIEQEVISKKIEEMLSVLEKRSQLITSFYRSMHISGRKTREYAIARAEKPVIQ